MKNKIKKYKVKGGKLIRPRKCRVCGCTWFHPCPGGCWWVEEDLCSSCAEKLELINNKAGHKMFWSELLYSDPPIRDKIQIIDPDEEYEVLSKCG